MSERACGDDSAVDARSVFCIACSQPGDVENGKKSFGGVDGIDGLRSGTDLVWIRCGKDDFLGWSNFLLAKSWLLVGRGGAW